MSFVSKTWHVAGMHCIRCETAVKKALTGLKGLDNISVSYAKGSLTAEWDSKLVSEGQIRDRLREAGYDFKEISILRESVKIAALLIFCAAMFVLILRNPIVSRLNLFPTASANMGLGAIFLIGVMTSLHCIAMCGGINLSQSGSSSLHGGNLWKSNLQYNLGRLISYTITGCIVGAIGSVFNLDTRVKAGIQLIAAIFMVIMACNLSGLFPWLQRFSIHLPKKLTGLVPHFSEQHFSVCVGLLNGLMPCGPLQSMQLFALSCGSWWMGGLSMFCFAAGTIPAMLGFGVIGGALNKRFGRPMQWISAGLVLFMGIGMLVNSVSLIGIGAAKNDSSAFTAQLSEDGSFQSMTTELEWNSYPELTVRTGIPVQWNMHVDEEKLIGCNNEIIIPAYDIDIHLDVGDNLIEFTPGESGTFGYACWMGMIRSSITVLDP